jgi:hypothetical protein
VLRDRGDLEDTKPDIKPDMKPDIKVKLERKPLMSAHPLTNHPSFISPTAAPSTNRNLFGSGSSSDSGRASGQLRPRSSGVAQIAKEEHRTAEGVVFYRILQAPVKSIPRGIDPPDMRFFTVDKGQMVSISVNI